MDKFLLFDWGGTLMEYMPSYLGTDHGWSSVPPVPGAVEMVQALSSSWGIGLASNASESDEEEVRAALDTINVGRLMHAIYTFRRAGRPKPWPEFWQYVLNDLALPANRIVMVGDDFMSDVWGATNVGMFGVWLNRGSDECKQGPRHTTIHTFTQLPAALAALGFE